MPCTLQVCSTWKHLYSKTICMVLEKNYRTNKRLKKICQKLAVIMKRSLYSNDQQWYKVQYWEVTRFIVWTCLFTSHIIISLRHSLSSCAAETSSSGETTSRRLYIENPRHIHDWYACWGWICRRTSCYISDKTTCGRTRGARECWSLMRGDMFYHTLSIPTFCQVPILI